MNDIDIKAPNDCDDVLNEIIAFAPEILFVSLGAPAQEFWINKYLKFFPIVRIAMGVGGSFDFLTEKIKRAPKIMRDLGVEWLYRLYKEPKRLKRIKNATADFLLACHRWSERIKNDFRMNALGVIINKDGKLLLIKNKRFKDHWQFPQGGIEAGETAEQAVIREISEEIGCDTKLLRIIRRMDETNKYVWPSYGQLLKGYKGQQQTAFVLEFNGNDSDIDMRKSSEAEDFKWVAKDDVLNELHRDRRQFAQDIIRHLD
ncbi:WecB/TagA/CpsF family glycosyltransferase [Candidatus Falkowbacteria bacterium]|nr:WecB/TagA/CpsF family glycosyltransferase [Candidatus Falkowbacteria bacterium]